MKIVPKMQAGGVVYTPHLTPLLASSWFWATLQAQQLGIAANSGSASDSSGSSKSGSDGLLTKDIIKDIYKNGLPNDVDAFLESVDIFGDSIMNGEASPTQYKQLLSYLNKVTYNKEVFDQGLKTALQKGIMLQPAIDSNGYVYIKRASGALTKKRVSQLGDGDIKNILSYGELATVRANDPHAAFDGGTIAEVLAGGISVTEVYKSIQDIANKIGNDSIEQDDIKLKSSKEKAVVEGILEIMSLPDGVYKITEKKDTQSKKAQIALRYILESLTPLLNAAIALQAKITGANPLLIVADGVTYTLKDSEKYSINWLKYKDEDGSGSGSSSGSGKGKTYEMNYLMQVVTGNGLQQTTLQIAPGTTTAYNVNAQVLPWIPNASGNGNVEPGSATEALLNSLLGRILNTDSIHVGEQWISKDKLNRMYFEGGGVHAVTLPFKLDEHGLPMPNFDLIPQYEKVLKEINRQGGFENLNKEKINQIFRNYGFGEYYNSDGTLNLRGFMRFVGINLTADESIYQDPDENGNIFTKIEDDDDYYREQMITNLSKGDKKHRIELDGDLYRAMAYIPIYDSFSNVRAATGLNPWAKDPGYLQEAANELYATKLHNNPPPQVIRTSYKNEI